MTGFRPDYVFGNWASRTSRRAVLYALFMPAKSSKQIMAQTLSLVGLWRQRLQQLAEHGWRPRSSSRGSAFAANCWPAFCFCRPQTPPCDLAHICPFCFARKVEHIYALFDLAIKNLPDPAGWKLVARVKSIREPFLDSSQCLELAKNAKRPARQETFAPIGAGQDWLAAAERKLALTLHNLVGRRRRFITRLDPHGAYSMTTVEASAECWHIRNRQLLLVPPDFQMPPEAPCSAWSEPARIKESEDLSPRSLARLVASTFGYPNLMLQGPPDLVALSLRARHRVRLSARFGALRQNVASASFVEEGGNASG